MVSNKNSHIYRFKVYNKDTNTLYLCSYNIKTNYIILNNQNIIIDYEKYKEVRKSNYETKDNTIGKCITSLKEVKSIRLSKTPIRDQFAIGCLTITREELDEIIRKIRIFKKKYNQFINNTKENNNE